MIVLALLLVAAACGRVEQTADDLENGDRFPVTIQADNGPVTIEEQPQRIVSLSPTATEMLYAIGAGDQVIAVDDQSSYPPEAPTTDLSGYTPNVEAVAGYDPDLIVFATETGELDQAFRTLGIPAIQHDAAETLDGTYDQIEQLGAATGNRNAAASLVSSMQAEVDEIIEAVPEIAGELTYYHELDSQLFTATSSTFIGQVYAELGLENIADEADADASGYPQLSAEYIVEADPDVILLANAQYGESFETVAARPGWDTITAVRNEAVIELDSDIASRWGPRIVDLLRLVAEELAELEPRVAT